MLRLMHFSTRGILGPRLGHSRAKARDIPGLRLGTHRLSMAKEYSRTKARAF